MSHPRCIFDSILYTPKIEPENNALDDFPYPVVYSQVPAVNPPEGKIPLKVSPACWNPSCRMAPRRSWDTQVVVGCCIPNIPSDLRTTKIDWTVPIIAIHHQTPIHYVEYGWIWYNIVRDKKNRSFPKEMRRCRLKFSWLLKCLSVGFAHSNLRSTSILDYCI